MSEQETHSSGLLYFIPYWIFEAENLSTSAKLAYALLSGLAHGNEKKECYPSDEYIASRLKLKRRASANELIKELEDFGAIEKRVESHPKNPFKRIRIITVFLCLKKCLRITENRNIDNPQGNSSFSKNVSDVTENRNPCVTENRTQSNKGNSNKEESTLTGTKESAPIAKATVRVSRAPHVFVSNEEHEKLVKRHGAETIQKAYERLSQWKEDTPKGKWKKNDHLAIERWVIEALREESIKAEKASKSPDNRIKEVQQYIHSHPKKETLKRAVKENRVMLGDKYMEVLGVREGYISFEDKSAKELINHWISKMSL